jgi:hypothetical protein
MRGCDRRRDLTPPSGESNGVSSPACSRLSRTGLLSAAARHTRPPVRTTPRWNATSAPRARLETKVSPLRSRVTSCGRRRLRLSRTTPRLLIPPLRR